MFALFMDIINIG